MTRNLFCNLIFRPVVEDQFNQSPPPQFDPEVFAFEPLMKEWVQGVYYVGRVTAAEFWLSGREYILTLINITIY